MSATRATGADWTEDALRRLAVAVLTDALLHRDQRFLTASSPAVQRQRRLWLDVLGLDAEATEAALRRVLALPWPAWAGRRAVLLDAPLPPGSARRRRWNRDDAFPGRGEGVRLDLEAD